MSKKLYFLMCFVLVLTLSGAAQAVPIDDPNYNLSFEYHWPDVCGVITQIYGHTGIEMDDPQPLDPCEPNQGVLNWVSTGSGFQGVDVFCPYAYDSPTHCHQWPGSDDPCGIAYIYLQHGGNGIHQILDGNDANAVITAGRKYTMTVDALDAGTAGVGLRFYSASGLIIEQLYPDLPEILQPIENCDSGENELDDACVDWHRDLTVSFMCLGGEAFKDETLELELVANSGGGQYAFMDNVRLEWMWLFNAYYPDPEDEAEEVPRVVTLSWTPGLWAKDVNAHEVYFGTDEAAVEAADRFDLTGIFRGPQNRDVNSYTPSELPLELGQTYYWRIDEVNEAYGGPPAAAPDANGRWKGDIWSFEVTGFAINPNPEDGAEDVSLYTDLSWTPGTDVNDVNGHDVYFGTGEAAVDDANQLSSEYMGRQDANDFNDFVPALELGKTYYWRIDEVNGTAGTLIKGKVWSFTVATYFRVDDMDSYVNDAAIKAVWNDYWTNGTRAETFRETSPDNVIDGQSMRYKYTNSTSPYYAEAYADMADLGMGSDWSKGGAKAWALSFKGKQGNALEPMYVALTDGSGRTGKVMYPDSNELTKGWKGFQEWNIELLDFVDDNNVDLTDISRITIGFGDKTAGGSGEVYFDNIRLYPPRCVPEYAHLTGSFRYLDHYKIEGSFVSDCKNDYFDLWSMGSDWLVSSYGNATATTPSDTNLMGHWAMDDDDPQLQVDDSSVNANHGTLYDEDRSPGRSTSKHHTDDCAEGTGALTFDGDDDYIEIPVLDLNSNTVTISAWIKRNGDLGEGGSYPRIVSCNEPNGAAFTFGSTSEYAPMEWSPNNELCYYWTGWSWDAHSGLIVPNQVWSFVALVVEPDKGTLYLYDGLSMKSSVNYEYHKVYDFNDVSFFGGAGFKGAMDDVYIYNRALSPEEILGLAGLSGTHYLALEPWRADANSDDKVDLKDYVIMARNWLKEVLWPFE